MTETTFYRPDQKTYGGIICLSDFCTDYKGTRNIASRIISDWKFDAQCMRNQELRERIREDFKCKNREEN